jgi:hypothetical protein
MTESDAGSPTTGPTIPRRPGIGEVLSFTGFLYGIGLMIHFRWLFLVVAVVFLVIGVARACAKASSGESSTVRGRAGVRTGKNHRNLFPLATAVSRLDSQVRPDQHDGGCCSRGTARSGRSRSTGDPHTFQRARSSRGQEASAVLRDDPRQS